MRIFSIALCLFPSASASEVVVLESQNWILANSFEQSTKQELQEGTATTVKTIDICVVIK